MVGSKMSKDHQKYQKSEKVPFHEHLIYLIKYKLLLWTWLDTCLPVQFLHWQLWMVALFRQMPPVLPLGLQEKRLN